MAGRTASASLTLHGLDAGGVEAVGRARHPQVLSPAFFLLFSGEVAPKAICFLSHKQTSPKRISFPPFFFFYIVPPAPVTKKGSKVTEVGPKDQDR